MSLLSDPTCPQIRDLSELVTSHATTSPDSAYVLYWRRLVHLHLRTVVKCDTQFLTLPPQHRMSYLRMLNSQTSFQTLCLNTHFFLRVKEVAHLRDLLRCHVCEFASFVS